MSEEEKKQPWYKRLWDWIDSLFREEYELTVWYVYEDYESDKGMKVKRRAAQKYQLKEISKKTAKHIIGRYVDGSKFEIKTVEPFDYEIKKIK